MSYDDALYDQAARVNHVDAQQYVTAHRWVQKPCPRNDIGIFRLRSHEAVLPMDPSLLDYTGAMLRFAMRVGEAEGRQPEYVLQDLAATKVDRHRPMRVGEGAASLGEAISLLAGLQQGLAAAACLALQQPPALHSALHSRASFAEAESFVSAARFSTTEMGFGVVIDTPLEVERAAPGFGRKASIAFMRSLAHLARSIRAGSPERILHPQASEPRVSAELCEAVLRMEASDLRFAISWSPWMPAPQGVPREVQIDRAMFEPLEKIAGKLRRASPALAGGPRRAGARSRRGARRPGARS